MGRRQTDEEPSTPAAPARGVGASLREARQRRGWTIELCAQQLRIRAAVLEAMEAGHFEKLPNGAYALGFVRSYADYLGLDRDEIARRVKAEAAALSMQTELVFPTPIAESRLPSGVVLALSAILAAGAYGLWYYQTASERVSIPRVAAVNDRLFATSERPPANSSAQAEAATVAAAPLGSAPAPNAVIAPAAPQATAVVADPAPQVAAVTPVATPAAPPAPASDLLVTPAPRQFGEAAGARILIKATGDSWVQVRDRTGTIVFSRILRPGDSYGVANQPGQLLTTGSAGVLDITVDGRKVPPIGRPGFTRKDVVLDPERLLAGTAVPPEAARPAPPAEPAARPPSPAAPEGGG
ncbi:MAG: helix-turn-helix domain-containing protein [Alphaproteobacteria bacterium]|nr:helix-turn-helix domain-containing protein [Alphaproteobacteria bacterium]